MNAHVIRAVFKRNFVSYFSNPTGYVFICLYVLLSAMAAFWPNEFFNANLANLDQLNRYLPYIMLVFIPAITMSIWADERRQGTDELLLTIPASDLDVVLGKYLAAVAIYTVALLFSLFNIVVLQVLGSPDLGLLAAVYIGYWLVGAAMLSIGMAASFLTSNLTVGFILGVVFNAPLAFLSSADVFAGVFGEQFTSMVKKWSLSDQFRDFGRGVISLSAVAYFGLLIVVMLYVSMLLIGRRHWLGGKDGKSMLGHYLIRGLAIVVVAASIVTLLSYRDYRADISAEQLSSLSKESRELIQNINNKRPVQVDAYISPRVPESYVQTRLNLLAMLRELEAVGRGKVIVRIHDTEQYSQNAALAEKQFGIQGREVASRSRGAMNVERIYLGVAFTCGLDKVVTPFFDRGVPVEYELVRSLATVSQQERKKVGVLITDAKLYGGFDMQRMTSNPAEPIIEELEKQYEVVQVNADDPITQQFDVLLAVQPSSLTQPQMDNFIAAVKSGQPTAIFEDPFPLLDASVPGTMAPKQPPGGMGPFGGGQPPQPKGNIEPLWNMLGVVYEPRQVIWQDYNPYKKITQFPREFVFVDEGSGQKYPFGESDAISSKLQQLLFLFPGFVRQRNISGLKFTPLVRTGDDTGEVAFDEILQQSFFGGGGGLNPARRQRPTRDEYILAAHIQGKLKEEPLMMSDTGFQEPTEEDAAGEPAAETPPAEAPTDVTTPDSADEPDVPAAPMGDGEIDVVLVADIDVLYSAFFALRNRGDDPDAEVNLALDNVTFVLNALDMLANDQRFIEIRKRRPSHRILTAIENWTEKARDTANATREKYMSEFDEQVRKAQAELDQEIEKLRQRTDIDTQQLLTEVQMKQEVGQKRLDAKTEQLRKSRDRDIEKIETELSAKIREVQDRCKLWAVAIPPILPLVLGAVVYFRRRAREREGVSKSRLR